MQSWHTSGPPGQPYPAERDALLAAGADVFGYELHEAVGDAPVFLTCECGGAPAVLQVFAGSDQPVDVLLSLRARCDRCGDDGHHVVTLAAGPSSAP